ncbi:hypothetical protein PMZ80_000650 [Knufia obscura]|uniref:MYND-type domain-containing protein n=1 Tax=Knufia obscura TaxID=1635080 RepID=A0ABR0S1F7_9EURO|nr:hypothetical protein PMZ80_000650 [Knufia obscura]
MHSSRLPQSDNPNTNFKGPRGSLQHLCGQCGTTGSKLSLCTGCSVVKYCCREHQVQHRPQHKSTCNKIKKCRTKLAREDGLVRNATPDFMTPANAFETNVGHFYGLLNTRDYMRARFDLADTIRKLGTLNGVREALDHLQDMLRLCRGDNMGVRDLIPAMMLQLDRDQECYDFVKWYETEGQRSDYDWGDMDLPFLNVKNANVLEGVEFIDRKYGGVHHVSAVMLLKLKLLVDIQNIKLSRRVLVDKMPPELWRHVELAVIRSPLSERFRNQTSRRLVAIEETLRRHVMQLARTLDNTNEHFIYGVLYADKYLSTRPGMYSPGSIEEMQLGLQYSFAAWWQTEGVLELLHSARTIAGKDSADEIDGMMGTSTFQSNDGSSRAKEELLEDVSINRLWGYLDWAVEDAGSLNAERPSDAHMKRLRSLIYSEDEDE